MHKLAGSLALFFGIFPLAAAPAFHLNSPTLPDGIVGKSYTGGPLVLAGGGQCPRNYVSVRVVTGSLPPGLYLTEAGQFVGAPMEAGRFEFVVRVENACGWSDQALTLEVAGTPVLLANPASLNFRVAPGQPVAPMIVQVSSNKAGLPYTVETMAPWVRARARSGRTPAAGSALSADLIEVEIDTASLPPGQHRGSIEIGGWRTAQSVSVPIQVEVLTAAGVPPAATHTGPSEHGGPAANDQNGPDPRLPRLSLDREEANAQERPPVAAATKRPAAAKAAPAGRLSRSAQLRSKYLASKTASPASPASPAAAPAAAHAKPSPVGEPVKKADAHGKPADAHAKPADAHAKPADAHAKPADAHAKPAAAHAKPADAHAKPADAHAKPADAHGKPADAHAKPADAKAKPAADAHAKPKEAAKH